MADIRLLRGRVMLRPIVETKVGRIILPDTAINARDNKPSLGKAEVLAMGPPALTKKRGHEMRPDFKVGDIVLHIGQHVSREGIHPETGERVRFCSQEEVQAVIENHAQETCCADHE